MNVDATGLAIIATECKSACTGEPDLEQRIRKSMAVVAKGHWMFVNNDDLCFRGAIGGAMLAPETTPEDRERIEASMKALRSLSALLSGLPMDTERMIAEMDAGPKPLPLMAIWHEAKTA